MKIPIQEAQQLAQDVLIHTGYTPSNASLITNHLIDSQLRGYTSAGLARILAIRDRLGTANPPKDNIEITSETPVLAHLNANDTFGYLVGEKATDLAISKAKALGIAIVAANNTWMTGMLTYYAEKAAKENLVTIITSNSTPWVAAEGGYKGLNGTNPVCIWFPSGGRPVILDMATSKVLQGDVVLAQRLDTQLPPGSGFNAQGEPTTDPWEVLQGAMAPWGGYKGSGLASMVQLFGVLAGSPAFPPPMQQFGFNIIAVDPSKFSPLEDYKREVDAYCKGVKESPAVEGGRELRLPFERSATVREETLEAGVVEVDDRVYATLQGILEEGDREE
ncbi:Malate/L-lactate dehydrogenase [Aspergillus varians]